MNNINDLEPVVSVNFLYPELTWKRIICELLHPILTLDGFAPIHLWLCQ